ncbi:MAG: isoprenylcysteine carboxylmethyltransferase family protein [Deltaproteobacteria bacterium]|nr:isoprenylcysteine carboxylmethyltransferase family protein [Deltaproteobacteria bacterium]
MSRQPRFDIDLLMDFLILLATLIWLPLVPLRLFLHSGIGFWKDKGGKSYLFFLVYWVLFGLLLLIFAPKFVAWKFAPFHGSFETGLLLVVSALLFHLWTIRTLGLKTFSTRPEVTPEKVKATLVATGPYRLVRHPFYFMEWFLLLGIALVTSSWMMVSILVANILTIPWVTTFEEKELTQRFGESYREYQRQVPRLIPFI